MFRIIFSDESMSQSLHIVITMREKQKNIGISKRNICPIFFEIFNAIFPLSDLWSWMSTGTSTLDLDLLVIFSL